MLSFLKRRPRKDTVAVHRAEARVDDDKSLNKLLKTLPEANEIRPRLKREFFARAWDREAGCDYWIMSDGKNVVCFTITGLTLQQAATIRVRWDSLKGRVALTEKVLADLIFSETGAIAVS